jgi:aspartate/methionine/tyrosine aminotransferase
MLTSLPPLASRVSALGADSAFDLLARVSQLRASGRNVVSFGIGEPDMDPPLHVVAASQAALAAGRTRYGPSEGLPELRAAIARHVAQTRGLVVDATQVVVAPGAKPIIFYAISTLVNPGDEVIYPNPGFPTYESVVRWLGATPVPMKFQGADFSVDRKALTDAFSSRTRLVILNSPNNPTGAMLSEDDLRFIASLTREHNCWVLTDEIYSQLVFRGVFRSIATLPEMQDRTIIMDGFSKAWAMTGWRLGFAVAHPDLAPLLARAETNLESCTCTFAQLGGLAALEGTQEATVSYVGTLRARAERAAELLNQIPGIHCAMPAGAFYVFPEVSEACRPRGVPDAETLADRLLEEAGVAVLPRSCFGPRLPGDTGEFVRLSIATSMENIEEGIARMRRFLAG